MSALKMFFCVLNASDAPSFTIHRDLNSIYTQWSDEKCSKNIGLIHIGFVRPKLPKFEEVEHLGGTILVSASVKWSLPDEYKTSNTSVLPSSGSIPFYQLLTGFGYDFNVEEDTPSASHEPSYVYGTQKNTHTIASAALEVLRSFNKPMSKEEIFGHIIDRDLYSFGAQKPLNVLNVELNRHTEGTDYSQAPANKLFGKTANGWFYALGSNLNKLEGWLSQLESYDPDLANACRNTGIYDDDSYNENKSLLPEAQLREIEYIRYQIQKSSVNIKDPSELIPILPNCILDAHISQLGLSVRTSNVFNVQDIFKLRDAIGYSLVQMMRWPNFGKKSIEDLCEALDVGAKRLAFTLPIASHPSIEPSNKEEQNSEEEASDKSNVEYISKTPLKEHFEYTLSLLDDKARTILELRTGYSGPVKTLEEVGQVMGVTRERVRQIQKKTINRIIETEFWDDCIAIKIGELLLNREQPLYLEMLEIEDNWFAGFMGNYRHLAAIIGLFSENEIKLLTINGAVLVSRINQETWENLLSEFRNSLKAKAQEQRWTKKDIELTFRASLEEKGALELLSILWGYFSDSLQFNSEGILLSYGKSIESVLNVILDEAESPLHFSEIAKRAKALLGRDVSNHNINSRLQGTDAKLYGRGTYGLKKFNPISDLTCKHIIVVVNKELHAGPKQKQWHATEILSFLQEKFPSLPQELDSYILNIILSESEELTYLNKNVWARADSRQTPEDRVDMADAFAKILEDAGTPLKGKEIKARLQAIRGVHEALQIQSTDRMLQVGPDTWGLYERDKSLTDDEIVVCLDALYAYLNESEKGIHHSEVDTFLKSKSLDHLKVSGYELLNLAQRDERFYMGRSMFLGLAEWGEDTRRLTIAQAVRLILSEMTAPMSINEIHAKVESVTGLEIDGTVTGILPKEGAKYNLETRLWEKVN
tara:strand:- start:2033 stop:4831 length:2799 start_codon:yes stop_codon:yes gene_type:complete